MQRWEGQAMDGGGGTIRDFVRAWVWKVLVSMKCLEYREMKGAY
jgi:hypothetical protein